MAGASLVSTTTGVARCAAIIDTSAPRETFEISLASDGVLRCTRVGYARFAVAGKPSALAMYWFEGYGGGLWLPFSDASSGTETYGGGRYLYDTIKGADLGIAGSRDRCSTSTSRTTRRARTTTAGRARCRRRKTGCRSR